MKFKVTYWFLSFIMPGVKRLGAAIVTVENGEDPMQKAWETGCNPGGEMKGYRIDPPAPGVPLHVLMDEATLRQHDLI